jgi:hypothetical protein
MSKMRRWFFMIIALAMASSIYAPAALSEESVRSASVSLSVDREYGYFIGDPVKVSYRITLPADLSLREETLPKENTAVDERLDIRERRIKESATADIRTYDLEIVYQLFSAADHAQEFRIPPFDFLYGPREHPSAYVSALPAVSIAISPLSSPGDSLKPHILRSWTSPSSRFVRRAGAALMTAGGALAALLFARRGGKHSHFKAALKRISREKDPAAALVIFRNVLNEKAGRAIFPGNLEDLLRVFPEAKVYENELLNLVLLSDDVSFNPKSDTGSNGLLGMITDTIKRLKRLETWT